eukprot:NODE_438_length_2755_cov_45.246581_g375_i0.p1 GENE.NODE_438_length_2755_cov_45.246581_g375_i0~~NODE_438_length_2755_cov_45.246581_g375_i0.p1  ORF type:complete len:834 (-),score=145.89 NODE_438_length_2755_cov_45.246581_g375_i0:192-2693(-)
MNFFCFELPRHLSARLTLIVVPFLLLSIISVVSLTTTILGAFTAAERLADDINTNQLRNLANNVTNLLTSSANVHITMKELIQSGVFACGPVIRNPTQNSLLCWSNFMKFHAKQYDWVLTVFGNYTNAIHYGYVSRFGTDYIYVGYPNAEYFGNSLGPKAVTFTPMLYIVVNNTIRYAGNGSTRQIPPNLSIQKISDIKDQLFIWETPQVFFSDGQITEPIIIALMFTTYWYYPVDDRPVFIGNSHHALEASKFSQVLSGVYRVDNEIIFITDKDQQFVASMPISSDMYIAIKTTEFNRSNYERVQLSNHPNSLLRACSPVLKNDPSHRLNKVNIWKFSYDGLEYILGCSESQHYNAFFFVCKVAPFNNYVGSVIDARLNFILVTCGTLVGMVILMAALAWMMTKPLIRIGEYLHYMANYSLTTFVGPKSLFSEINTINQAFASMVEQLNAYKAFLPPSRLPTENASPEVVISPTNRIVTPRNASQSQSQAQSQAQPSLPPTPPLVIGSNLNDSVEKDKPKVLRFRTNNKEIRNPLKPPKTKESVFPSNLSESKNENELDNLSTIQDVNLLSVGLLRGKMTALLVNIRGFTDLAESMSPMELCYVHAQYIDVLISVADLYHAGYNSFVGDTMLLMWTATQPSTPSSLPASNMNTSMGPTLTSACTAANCIIERTKRLDLERKSYKVKVSVALCYGKGRYGNLGINKLRAPALVGPLAKSLHTLQKYCSVLETDILVDHPTAHLIQSNVTGFIVNLVGLSWSDEPNALSKLYALYAENDDNAGGFPSIPTSAINAFLAKEYSMCISLLPKNTANPMVNCLLKQARIRLGMGDSS